MSDAPKRLTIAEAMLMRITRDQHYASSRSVDKSENLSRFKYNHGTITIVAENGDEGILFEPDGSSLRSKAAHCLWQMSPKIVIELIRGYRLARAAGLLGDGVHDDDAMQWVSRRGHGFSVPERIASGAEIMADVSKELHRKLFK
jgi:hypothetical protein